MKHFYVIQFIFLIGLFALSSCGDTCTGTTGEPILHLSFLDTITNRTVNPEYSRVYAIDGKNEIKDNIDFNLNGTDYQLPFSTVEDQITYVFERNNQPVDTLIVTYDRVFQFDDDPECGLGMNLNNVILSPQTSFTPASFNNVFAIQQTSRDVYELLVIF
ncbi:MAG TPA: hypothetical protein DCS93_44655 [Microscillaceae bacterium]|nr:hypothetical protein [Microscillaceae bacterium]